MGGYIGARAGSLTTTVANVQDVTATDTTPEVTIINNTHEDTDGGREGKVIFKGQQSGGEESTLAEIQASHDGTADDEKGDLIFRTNDGSDGSSPTERMRIDSDGDISFAGSLNKTAGTGTFAIDTSGSSSVNLTASSSMKFTAATGGGSDSHQFINNTTEAMRIDSSGRLLVGKTATTFSVAGCRLDPAGNVEIVRAGHVPLSVNRTNNNGKAIRVYQDGTETGAISGYGASTEMSIGSSHTDGSGVYFSSGNQTLPMKANSLSDNTQDLGKSNFRWDDVFATNGTIQTSDEREKQQIASLTDAEMTAAKAISKLFKTFKWNDSVAENGDAARTHTGVIAQQVETAMSDAGLDAGKYAFFISTTWWEADETYTDDEGAEQTRTNTYNTQEEAPEGATERNRKGIRYPELLSFIGAATEQRLTSIEARLAALEAE